MLKTMSSVHHKHKVNSSHGSLYSNSRGSFQVYKQRVSSIPSTDCEVQIFAIPLPCLFPVQEMFAAQHPMFAVLVPNPSFHIQEPTSSPVSAHG